MKERGKKMQVGRRVEGKGRGEEQQKKEEEVRKHGGRREETDEKREMWGGIM